MSDVVNERIKRYQAMVNNHESLNKLIVYTIQLEDQLQRSAEDFKNLKLTCEEQSALANSSVDFLLKDAPLWTQKTDRVRELTTTANTNLKPYVYAMVYVPPNGCPSNAYSFCSVSSCKKLDHC